MADAGAGEKLKVFISYPPGDSAAFADELVAGLELAGFAPFLDRHDIVAGLDWEARRRGLIAQSDAVVFVVSPETVKSAQCTWEVDRTTELSKRLLPVIYKSISDHDIPEKLRGLQFVRFDTGPGFARPLSDLAAALRVDKPGPVAVAKRAVSWLDVFVFAIFVTASLSALSIADRTVTEQRRGQKPVKEHYELIAAVPVLQANFTMAQDELKTLRGKLVELRMEARRLAADPASAQPDQAVKLKAAETKVSEYEGEMTRQVRQVADAATATFGARRAAELAYDQAVSAFERTSKLRAVTFALAAWAVLALATWAALGALRKWLGHGRALHVLLPGSGIMLFASIFYVLK
jgi:TIR domain